MLLNSWGRLEAALDAPWVLGAALDASRRLLDTGGGFRRPLMPLGR